MKKQVNITPGDDFSDIINPIIINDTTIAVNIWLLREGKYKSIKLSGLYLDGIIRLLSVNGYYKRFIDNKSCYYLVQNENIIEKVSPTNIRDFLFNYINEIDKELEFLYKGETVRLLIEDLRETFLRQSNLICNETFLEHLPNHDKDILIDDKNNSYFFFKNKIAHVSKAGINYLSYSDIRENCIWRNQIKDHNFEYHENYLNSVFAKFINNVTNNDEQRRSAFISAIGYLLHSYSHRTQGQAIIAYDEEITDFINPKGGTGKGIFANALKQLRDLVKIDGKNFDPKDKFKFQDVTVQTQIIWLDDPKYNFEFEIFHSCLTDGWNFEKKFENQIYIKPENSPKLLISSNSILKGEGTTNKRRQFPLEFSNHYSSKIIKGVEEPIKNEHGCVFFDKEEWSVDEWNMFYSFMLNCSMLYFSNGLMPYEINNINKNKLIQESNEDFYHWIQSQNFETGIKYLTKEKYEDFKDIYYGSDSDIKQRTFTNWIKKWAGINGWSIVISKSNGNGYFHFLLK